MKEHNVPLNTVGGEIKGNSQVKLEQSSTMSDEIFHKFKDGVYKIPGGFMEFAKRHDNFEGFIAKSANAIFDSTRRKK